MLNNHGKLNWEMDKLWNGCMLAAVAHAIMVAHYPVIAHEHAWDEFNYITQRSGGLRGIVTFYDDICVAAFRNEQSNRVESGSFRDAIEYLWNTPIEILELAQRETFQYMLDGVNGMPQPVITTACWCKDGNFVTNDTFEDFWAHGGDVLEWQLMEYEDAFAAWSNYYKMSPQQERLLKVLYSRVVDDPDSDILLSKNDLDMIGFDNPEGFHKSTLAFNKLGIYFDI